MPRVPCLALAAAIAVLALPSVAQTWSAPLRGSAWVGQPSWVGNPAPAGGFGAEETKRGVRLRVAAPGTGMKFHWRLPAEVDPTAHKVVTLRYRAKGISRQAHYALCVLGSPRTGTDDYLPAIAPGELIADTRWHTAWADMAPVARKLKTITGVASDVQAAGAGAWLEIEAIELTDAPPAAGPWDAYTQRPGAAFGAVQPLALGAQTAQAPFDPAIRAAADGGITVEGVPFRLEPARALVTGMAEKQTVTVAADGCASEVYLLLEADLTGKDDAIHGGGALRAIREVDRFRVRLAYADGTIDEHLPVGLPGGLPGLAQGAQALAAPADPQRRLASVGVVDVCAQASLQLLAVSVRRSGARLAHPDLPVAALPAHRAPGTAPGGSRVALAGRLVRVTAGRCSAEIDFSGVPMLRGLKARPSGRTLIAAPRPLLLVELDGKPARLMPTAEPAMHKGHAEATYRTEADPGVCLRLVIAAVPNGFMAYGDVWGATASHRLVVRLCVGPYTLPGGAAGSWYLYPKRGAALDNRDCAYSERYSGLFPLQFVDTFAPTAGVGLSLRSEDRDCLQKRYLLTKSGSALTAAVELHADLRPGVTCDLAPVVLEITDGRAGAGLEAYRSWVASWYRPIAPRKPWFRQVFNFRQRFLHWLDPLDDGKQIDLQRAVTEAKAEFGGIDYLHLFDWGNAGPLGRSYARPGDTEPWPYLSGGKEGLARAMAGVKAQGIRTGLYIEGYLLESNGKLGKTPEASQWQILSRQGAPAFYPESTERFICPAVEPWRGIQAKTYADALANLSPDGMYVDEFGFGDEGKDCWAPNHGHAVPSYSVTAESGMLARIRRAVGPEIAIYSEETPVDVNSEMQDGSFTYAMNQAYGTVTRAPLNAARFCLPGFKTIEILYCDQPTASWATGVKQAFFNGEALWLEGPATEWFASETRAAIRRCYGILHGHSRTFGLGQADPLVATLRPGLYANRFRLGGETIYTLYNATPATLRGDLLAVTASPAAGIDDLWRGAPARTRRQGGTAVIIGEIGPYGVGCVRVRREEVSR
jgi:hypothetical protein